MLVSIRSCCLSIWPCQNSLLERQVDGENGEATRRQQIHGLSKGLIQVDKLSLQTFEPVFHLPAQIAFVVPQPLALLLRRSLVFTE